MVKGKSIDDTGRESDWSEPITVQIVTLKPTIIVGFISDKNDVGEFIIFNPKLLVIIPSNYYIYYSGESIIISNDYQSRGRVWPKFVIGIFNATIISELYSAESHPFSNRLFNCLYLNKINH